MSGSEGGLEKPIGRKADRALRSDPTVVTFQPGLIDMLMKHATKGRLVYVAGKMQTRRWRRNGEDTDRFATEILLIPGSRIQFLEKAGANLAATPMQDRAASANGEAMPLGGDEPDADRIPF